MRVLAVGRFSIACAAMNYGATSKTQPDVFSIACAAMNGVRFPILTRLYFSIACAASMAASGIDRSRFGLLSYYPAL